MSQKCLFLVVSVVLHPAKVTSRASDEDVDVDEEAQLRCIDHGGADLNSHRTAAITQQALNESTNVGVKSNISRSRGPKLGIRW